ncbi:hypothetical protein FO519_006738, partial [Halicephalobus sp. NKZ332]
MEKSSQIHHGTASSSESESESDGEHNTARGTQSQRSNPIPGEALLSDYSSDEETGSPTVTSQMANLSVSSNGKSKNCNIKLGRASEYESEDDDISSAPTPRNPGLKQGTAEESESESDSESNVPPISSGFVLQSGQAESDSEDEAVPISIPHNPGLKQGTAEESESESDSESNVPPISSGFVLQSGQAESDSEDEAVPISIPHNSGLKQGIAEE